MAVEKEKEKYPLYMYHKDYDEPKRVDNKDEKRALEDRGFTKRYIHKSYPKYVNGIVYNTKAEHEAAVKEMPKVEVVKTDIKTGDVVKKTVSKGGKVTVEE